MSRLGVGGGAPGDTGMGPESELGAVTKSLVSIGIGIGIGRELKPRTSPVAFSCPPCLVPASPTGDKSVLDSR